MSTASKLLAELRRADIRLRVEDGRLHYRAPAGVLTEDLRQAVAEHKASLLELLARAEQPEAPEAPSAQQVLPAAEVYRIPLDNLHGWLDQHNMTVVGGDLHLAGMPWRPRLFLKETR